jgi:hypothetical protein
MPTLLAARTALRERLSEPTAAAWSDGELNRYLNEGVREIAIRTECLAATADVAVSTGVYLNNVPATVNRIHRAEWAPSNPVSSSDQIYPLRYTQINNLDSMRGSGQQTITGIPEMFSTWGYPGTSTFKVVLYPKPQTAGTLRIHYYRIPVDLTADTDLLDIPNGWDHLVYDYAEFRARLKDGDDAWQVAKSEFEGRLDLFKNQFARLVDENDTIGVDAFTPQNWMDDGFGW